MSIDSRRSCRIFQVEQNAMLFGKTSENFPEQRSVSARQVDNEHRSREVITVN